MKVPPSSQASITKPSESDRLKGSQVWRLPVAPTMGQGPTASWPPLWSLPYHHPRLVEEQKPMGPSQGTRISPRPSQVSSPSGTGLASPALPLFSSDAAVYEGPLVAFTHPSLLMPAISHQVYLLL